MDSDDDDDDDAIVAVAVATAGVAVATLTAQANLFLQNLNNRRRRLLLEQLLLEQDDYSSEEEELRHFSRMAPSDHTLQRYKLIVAYDGTRYKGFQRQSAGNVNEKPLKRRRVENSPKTKKKTPLTIQESIEDALEHFSGLDRITLKVRFAGRTDAGVHARGQVLAVSLPLHNREALWQVQKSINSRLPADISIDQVSECDDNFNPREDVKWKRYSYTLKYRRKVSTNGEPLPICSSGPNSIRCALDPSTLWVVPWVLDDSKLDEFCKELTGNHDYSVFVHKRARRDKSNVLTVDKLLCKTIFETEEAAPVLTVRFDVEAKGFRRSMVRNLIGFLVDICRGAVDESIFQDLWSGDDALAAKLNMAPACGLCMEHVQY